MSSKETVVTTMIDDVKIEFINSEEYGMVAVLPLEPFDMTVMSTEETNYDDIITWEVPSSLESDESWHSFLSENYTAPPYGYQLQEIDLSTNTTIQDNEETPLE